MYGKKDEYENDNLPFIPDSSRQSKSVQSYRYIPAETQAQAYAAKHKLKSPTGSLTNSRYIIKKTNISLVETTIYTFTYDPFLKFGILEATNTDKSNKRTLLPKCSEQEANEYIYKVILEYFTEEVESEKRKYLQRVNHTIIDVSEYSKQDNITKMKIFNYFNIEHKWLEESIENIQNLLLEKCREFKFTQDDFDMILDNIRLS